MSSMVDQWLTPPVSRADFINPLADSCLLLLHCIPHGDNSMSKMAPSDCISALRKRIYNLYIESGKSLRKISGDLDHSDSYLRNITNEGALPSVEGLFKLIAYFNMDPAEFFSTMTNEESRYSRLCDRIRNLKSDDDLTMLECMVSYMEKKSK